MSAALVILSGGQDSTTCLYWAKRMYKHVHALTFDYDQRHNIEVDCAKTIARMAGVVHEVISLGPILKGTSPLVNRSVEVESYASASALPGGIEKTFVPMRNALFMVLAANRAVVLGCEVIITGVSMEDYGGYPDCRSVFIDAANEMIRQAIGESAQPPTIVTPLMELDKRETVEMAMELDGCMEALAHSHTCYMGQRPPCGVCHACLLRARGFEEAGVVDPLIMETA